MDHCPLCESSTVAAGETDLNKSGADLFAGERQFACSPERVSFVRCTGCGFMFTGFFADWSDADFKARIYNDSYVLADPPFEHERPARLAMYLGEVLGAALPRVSLLDFGAGEGRMVQHLLEAGLVVGDVYDRYHADVAAPSRQYDLVTAFEVVEHVPDQAALFDQLCDLVAPDGVLLLSTLLQPPGIESLGADWWYACPRNGHMAFHTSASLRGLLESRGFTLQSLSDELHMGVRAPGPLSQRLAGSERTLKVSGEGTRMGGPGGGPSAVPGAGPDAGPRGA